MGFPARIVRFLGLTAWDLLLPDFIEKPTKIAYNLYQCFVATDPAEKLALLADARRLTETDIDSIVHHLAAQFQAAWPGGLTTEQRHLLRSLVLALHQAGQAGAAGDPAKALRQSLRLQEPKTLSPDQRAILRTTIHAALTHPTRGARSLPANAPKIDGYTLLRVLGDGAFSVVYLGRHTAGQTLHAIKVFRPEDRQLFEREVRLLARVQGQHLVQYRDHGNLVDADWIAMEYLGDFTLRDLIIARPTGEQSLILAEQMLRGLDELHRAGVIHRDLKPENAVVDHHYRLRLIDFGLSRLQDGIGASKSLGTVGTALYMSPEQIHSQATFASDIWAFGCILHELLVGKPVFAGKNVMAVAIDIEKRPIACDQTEIPEEIRPFLSRCLQRKVEDRYANAGDALSAFLPVAKVARNRLRYAHFQASWNAILSKKLLERFIEQTRGEVTEDAVTQFAALAAEDGITDVDEHRLAEILPLLAARQRDVLAAEQATLAANEEFQRRSAGLSGVEQQQWLERIEKLKAVPEQRRDQMRQEIENQLSREVAGWHKLQEAEAAAEKRRRAELQLQKEANAQLRGAILLTLPGLAGLWLGFGGHLLPHELPAGVPGLVGLGLCLPGAAYWAHWLNRPSRRIEVLEMDAGPDGVPRRKRFLFNGVYFDFVLIQPGRFRMGTGRVEGDCKPHTVEITRPYYLLTTQVTQEMYQAVLGTVANQSYFRGNLKRPVEMVSWHQAKDFCQTLSEFLGVTFQLPTEAQWEYACRAGSDWEYCFGRDSYELYVHAWVRVNSESKTHPVATKKANRWGLYDMHGNVSEWCEDAYRKDYESLPAQDPVNEGGPTADRVIRGGSWNSDDAFCTSCVRVIRARPEDRKYDIGFRIVLVA